MAWDHVEKKPPSGIPAKGASKHGPDCQCGRCLGFQPGNELTLKHGGRRVSLIRLQPRAEQLAEKIRELVPGYREADTLTVELLAMQLAQIEDVSDRIPDLLEREDFLTAIRGQDHVRKFVSTARGYLADLGLSPRARAALGVDVAVIATRVKGLRDMHAEERALEEAGHAGELPAAQT